MAVLTVACINLEFGGLDRQTGDASRLHASLPLLARWAPDVILAREVTGIQPCAPRRHARMIASTLAVAGPVLGPVAPQSASGNRTAIFVRPGLEVIDDGPPQTLPGLAWCEAPITVLGRPVPLLFASVDLPARSGTAQLIQAETLASYIAGRNDQPGCQAVVGGDWNGYAPDDALTAGELAVLPPHLRPSRMRQEGGILTAAYDVHDTLTCAGLADPVPALPPRHRDPSCPPGTGSHPRARTDRFYLWPGPQLLPAVRCYHQQPSPGSDHHMLMICLDPAGLASTRPPGPRP